MNTGVVLTVAGLLLAFLTWMDLRPNGPRLLARLMVFIVGPRKEVKELRRQVAEWRKRNDDLGEQVFDLTRGAGFRPHKE
jgi:hypothetical protein